MISKKENWLIFHDNGVAGQYGYSDGYASRSEVDAAVKSMTASGIVVYDVLCTKEGRI